MRDAWSPLSHRSDLDLLARLARQDLAAVLAEAPRGRRPAPRLNFQKDETTFQVPLAFEDFLAVGAKIATGKHWYLAKEMGQEFYRCALVLAHAQGTSGEAQERAAWPSTVFRVLALTPPENFRVVEHDPTPGGGGIVVTAFTRVAGFRLTAPWAGSVSKPHSAEASEGEEHFLCGGCRPCEWCKTVYWRNANQ